MKTLLPILALIVAAVLMLFWSLRRKKLVEQARHDIGDTLQACRLLVRLVGHLQQHRGMSSAWLAGDATFAARLHAKQAEIAALLPELVVAARREGKQPCPCLSTNDLSLFTYRWKTLLDELKGLTPEQSIAQHSQLIARALEWLAALGEARIEPLSEDARVSGAARNFAHRLPQLTECLGQARAIGSSVAARRACAPVARVRLMFLISRAETLLDQANVAWNGGLPTRKCRLAVEELASTVRTQMLLSSGVAVSSSEYFALASRAIDAVFEWIDNCAGEVESGTAPAGATGPWQLQVSK